jgi:hypothetical protein
MEASENSMEAGSTANPGGAHPETASDHAHVRMAVVTAKPLLVALVALLFAACASQTPRCDGRLQPINAPGTSPGSATADRAAGSRSAQPAHRARERRP